MDPPTREEFEELKAEFAALREEVSAIAGALNALVVVYTVRRLPDKPGDADER